MALLFMLGVCSTALGKGGRALALEFILYQGSYSVWLLGYVYVYMGRNISKLFIFGYKGYTLALSSLVKVHARIEMEMY